MLRAPWPPTPHHGGTRARGAARTEPGLGGRPHSLMFTLRLVKTAREAGLLAAVVVVGIRVGAARVTAPVGMISFLFTNLRSSTHLTATTARWPCARSVSHSHVQPAAGVLLDSQCLVHSSLVSCQWSPVRFLPHASWHFWHLSSLHGSSRTFALFLQTPCPRWWPQRRSGESPVVALMAASTNAIELSSKLVVPDSRGGGMHRCACVCACACVRVWKGWVKKR